MNAQPALFDALASEQAKQAGIDQAASNKTSLLPFARTLAVEIAQGRPDHTCTADDVVRALTEQHHISPHALGNAAGALFRGPDWIWDGRFVRSERAYAHANLIRVWVWVGDRRRKEVAA